MRLRKLAEDLLGNKLPAATVSFIANCFFAFVVIVGLPSLWLGPSLTTGESIFFKSVEAFVKQPNIQIGQLSPFALKIYLYSLPVKLTANMETSRQISLIRLLGLAFFMLALWLAYQIAKRVFTNNDFMSLAVLALLATNGRLNFSATTVGGDAFLFCFLAFFIYELVEITAKGSMVDVLISLVLIFLLSKIDIQMAQNIALPILFFIIIATMLAKHGQALIEALPKSAQARAAIGGALVIAFLLAQRLPFTAMLLLAPTAFFIGIISISSWPGVMANLAAYFSAAPGLTESFSWAQKGLTVTFQLAALAGAGGLAQLLYQGVRQHVEVAKKASIALPGGGSTDAGYQVIWRRPQISVFGDFNLPAFLAIALMPLVVFAAQNTYAVSNVLGDQNLIFLTIPLTLLLAAGLRQIFSIKSLSEAIGLLIALLTFNVAVILLTILW